MRPTTALLTWTATAALIGGAAAEAVHRARVAAGPALPVAQVGLSAPIAPTTTTGPAVAEAVDPGPTPAVPRAGRPPSTLSLDGHTTPFPAANLTVTKGRGGLHAVLCTDDPTAALDAGYSANSFMFDMVVPVDRAADLPGGSWTFTDASSDATGVYLRGTRDQLTPTPGVRVAFAHDGRTTLATITGTFLKLDTRDPLAAPERVSVYGIVRCLPAQR